MNAGEPVRNGIGIVGQDFQGVGGHLVEIVELIDQMSDMQHFQCVCNGMFLGFSGK